MNFENILFYADGSRGENYALRNAMDLAEMNGASLTVIDVVPFFSSNEDRLQPSINRLQDAVVKERSDELEETIGNLRRSRGARDVEILLVPGEKGFIEVIRQVVVREYDLLVKAGERTSAITSRMFGNSDMRFIRQCPCPVWIIKSGRRHVKTILAAVDLSDTAEATRQFADRIIRLATGLGRLENSQVHVLTVYENLDQSIRKMDADMYRELNTELRHEHQARFRDLVPEAPSRMIESHMLIGEPHKVITRFVDDYSVDLLVMGTLSSMATPGLLIGSTAEFVINSVDCSVLTIKPEDFTTIIAQ